MLFIALLVWVHTSCDDISPKYINLFLKKLSESYTEDTIIWVYDGAAWHKANALIVSENIRLLFIPPATPEMNPIEQIWKEICKHGFRNEIFQTLD